ncbi:bifunctional DNA primase/polymerase [Amycolatopsis minnesotensis]|uniref:Bifunctional DNA primase/polymerase n=1 Tax=Amycolatopsis minnesotensis TaxID=337894 RepID=A0ABN2SHD5_9PSEU
MHATETDTQRTTARDLAAGLRDWALHLAGRKWPVFPLLPGRKIPRWHLKDKCPGTGRCAHGHVTPEQIATTDPDVIRATWVPGGTPWNIAVFPGPAGLLVVDLDVPDPGEPGPDGWTALQTVAAERGGPTPDTFTVDTPSGGRHLYYRAPAGCSLRSTAKHIAANVDTRAWGGYVVAPGSLTPEGAYRLIDDADPVELPGWLVQANTERATTPGSASATGSGGWPAGTSRAPARMSAYVAAAVTGETDRIRAAHTGRNTALSRAAYALGQLVGAEVLDLATARAELVTAWESWNTPDSWAKDAAPGGVIDTSLAAGQANRRRITTRRLTTRKDS